MSKQTLTTYYYWKYPFAFTIQLLWSSPHHLHPAHLSLAVSEQVSGATANMLKMETLKMTFCSKQRALSVRIKLQYFVWPCFFLSRIHSLFLQQMNDRCKSRLNAGAYTEVFFPCHHIHRVFFPALFISIQRHSDEKEFRSCLSREVSPLHAFLAALLARLRVTQDQIHPKISGSLQKRKRISPPPHSITLSPKGREEQNVCQNGRMAPCPLRWTEEAVGTFQLY